MTLQGPFFYQGLFPNGNKLAVPFNYNFIPDLCLACLNVWNILWHKIGMREEGTGWFNKQ